MKVTFLVDHQSAASGNEFYRAGAQADLPRASTLIEVGVAYEGWGEAPTVEGDAQVEKIADPIEDDYSTLTMAELRKLADEQGIPHSNLRKAKLVEALSEAE